MLSAAVISCKDSEEKKDNPEATETVTEDTSNTIRTKGEEMYRGEFIYTADAAVLKGKDFIYGVTMNDMAKELADRVAEIPKEEYDMVPVIVEGDLVEKSDDAEGWDKVITITKILNVSNIVVRPDIKMGKSKENK